ncbi:MAG: TonB-dependent receptor plug domain-containing protein [Chlorobi bacterium]|nr:TonB-dependent receptor plug domain-containing protein [Chlorobiota bacterium]
MRYLLIILLQVLYLSLSAQHQQFLVSGKVFDSKTGKPLTEVQVIYSNNKEITTDSTGYFEFPSNLGKIEITFILFGYQTLNKSVIVLSNIRNKLSVGLKPFINQLNEVVISADKTGQRVSELSVSMSVIKPYEITKNHIVNAEEIIKQTQGIEIIDGQASIRGGSGFSYGAGSRVMVLIDGLPVISADAGNIRWQFLPIENLAQIEIIKGASSVLYGSSAINGIINFITAEADTIPQIKFSLTSGIYDKPKRKELVWWNTPRSYSDASFSFSQKIKNTEISLGSNLLYNNGYRKLNDEKLARLNFNIKQHSNKIKGLSYGLGFLGGYNNKTDFILWENSDAGALIQNKATATELNVVFVTLDPYISLKNNNISKQEIRV